MTEQKESTAIAETMQRLLNSEKAKVETLKATTEEMYTREQVMATIKGSLEDNDGDYHEEVTLCIFCSNCSMGNFMCPKDCKRPDFTGFVFDVDEYKRDVKGFQKSKKGGV